MILLLLVLTLSIGIPIYEIMANTEDVSPTRRNNENVTFRSGELIWQDEFDFIDATKWKNEININGGYNNEFQIYDTYPENGFVKDGVFYIKPTQSLDTVFGGNMDNLYNGYLNLTNCTDAPGSTCSRQAQYPHINQPVVSQRLRTEGLFSFRYGRIVARARMPSGDWMWPAIWLLPEEWKYGPWPLSGEIDLVESRGNRKLFDPNGVNIRTEQMGSTLHFGMNKSINGFMKAHATKNTEVDQGYDRDFHIYELIWTPNDLQFKVDDVEVLKIDPPAGGFFELGEFPNNLDNPWKNGANPKMSPFDENFHILINVAVGGGFFEDLNSNPPTVWNNSTPYLDFFNDRENWQPSWTGDNAAMAIDYIRVYAI